MSAKYYSRSDLADTDSDYLCPFCYEPLYVEVDVNKDICLNVACPSYNARGEIAGNVSDHEGPRYVEAQLRQRVKDFCGFSRKFVLTRLYQERAAGLASFLQGSGLHINAVAAINYLMTQLAGNTTWGLSEDEVEYRAKFAAYRQYFDMAQLVESLALKTYIVTPTGKYFVIKYHGALERFHGTIGVINYSGIESRARLHAFSFIDKMTKGEPAAHEFDFKKLYENLTPLVSSLNHVFRAGYATSRIHMYPFDSEGFATLYSLWTKCGPNKVATATLDYLRYIYDGTLTTNNMHGDFDRFLKDYTSGDEYAPVLVFDGEKYHFDYPTLFLYLLYIFSHNHTRSGTQTEAGSVTHGKKRQEASVHFEAEIRRILRTAGFETHPGPDGEKFAPSFDGERREFDCIAVDHGKKIVVLVEAKYRDISPSSTAGAALVDQLVLDRQGGLLGQANDHHERRRFFIRNFSRMREFGLRLEGCFLGYTIHTLMVTKHEPLISRHKSVRIVSYDKFKSIDFGGAAGPGKAGCHSNLPAAAQRPAAAPPAARRAGRGPTGRGPTGRPHAAPGTAALGGRAPGGPGAPATARRILMRLRGITLANFKSFADKAEIPIGQITSLVGPNGAGKSNAIHGLQKIAAILSGGEYVPDRADYFDDNDGAEMRLGATLELSDAERRALADGVPFRLVRYEAVFKDDDVQRQEIWLAPGDGTFRTFARATLKGGRYDVVHRRAGAKRLDRTTIPRTASLRRCGQSYAAEIFGLIGGLLFPTVQGLFFGMRFVPAGRAMPDMMPAHQSDGFFPNGQNLLNELNVLCRAEQTEFNKRMASVTHGDPSGVEPRPVGSDLVLEERERGLSRRSVHTDLGSGQRQTLIFGWQLFSGSGTIVAVKEPELHLHAERQKQVLGPIRDKAAKDDVQFVVETHLPVVLWARPSQRVVLVTKDAGRSRATEIGAENVGLIQRELGITHADALSPANILFVEGRSDLVAFGPFLKVVAPEHILSATVYSLDGAHNTKNFKMLIKYLKAVGRRMLAILDENGEARHQIKELKDGGLLNGNPHFLEKSLEDEFDSGLVAEAARETATEARCALALTAGELDASRKRGGNVVATLKDARDESRCGLLAKVRLAERMVQLSGYRRRLASGGRCWWQLPTSRRAAATPARRTAGTPVLEKGATT